MQLAFSIAWTLRMQGLHHLGPFRILLTKLSILIMISIIIYDYQIKMGPQIDQICLLDIPFYEALKWLR